MTCLDHGFFESSPESESMLNIALIHCQTIESPILVIIPIILTGMTLFILSHIVHRLSGYKFFQIRHRRHGFGLLENPPQGDSLRPVQIPMVPWFSVNLTTTAIQLLVTLQIFVGRLDIRHILKSLCKEESDIIHDLRMSDPWIDFFADGGDGFNSSYSVVRMMAQPNLSVSVPRGVRYKAAASSGVAAGSSGSATPRVMRSASKSRRTPNATVIFGGSTGDGNQIASTVIQRRQTNPNLSLLQISPARNDTVILPRASVVVHGGDLAYPRPSFDTYKDRFVGPIEAAFPAGPGGGSAGSRPRMFLIPGNHDWYDSCESFIHWIIGKSGLGGWKLPQKNSYFALRLRAGWWVLGMDLALTNDLDVFQYQEFSRIIDELISESDRVVVIAHRPQWVFDAYHASYTGDLFHHLLDKIGPQRLAMRLAGDIHHYSRFTGGHGLAQLVIAGGGGAFLHPTHVPEPGIVHEYFSHWEAKRREENLGYIDEESEDEVIRIGGSDSPVRKKNSTKKTYPVAPGNHYRYTRACSFPNDEISRKLAWLNPLHFRDRNWGADIIMGVVYICMGISVVPLCDAALVIDAISDSPTVTGAISAGMKSLLLDVVFPSLKLIWTNSVFSLMAQIAFYISCFAAIGETRHSTWQRAGHAFVHFILHAFFSVVIFALLEISIEFLSLVSLGKDSVITDGFRVPGIVSAADSALFGRGILETSLGWFLRFVDLPSSLIRNRRLICEATSAAATGSRQLFFRYYSRILPFFWVLATPVAAFVMGCYLLVSLNVFGIHMTEAFSSLRIEDYKHFIRMYIDPETSDLHVYVIGIEKVAKNWEEDPAWDPKLFAVANQPLPPSSRWVTPSRWRPVRRSEDSDPKLVDYFVIPASSDAKKQSAEAPDH